MRSADRRFLHKSLADCIKTNEFMHVYNAIIVLKEILPVFPLSAVIDLTGPPLNQVIETFIEKEERGDLKILARAYVARMFPVHYTSSDHPSSSYHASLKKREHLWAPANVLAKVRLSDLGEGRVKRANLDHNRRLLHLLLVLPHPCLRHLRATRRKPLSLYRPQMIG